MKLEALGACSDLLSVLGSLVMDVTLGMLCTKLGAVGAGRYERAFMDGNVPGTGCPNADAVGVVVAVVSAGEVAVVSAGEVAVANADRAGDMGLHSTVGN